MLIDYYKGNHHLIADFDIVVREQAEFFDDKIPLGKIDIMFSIPKLDDFRIYSIDFKKIFVPNGDSFLVRDKNGNIVYTVLKSIMKKLVNDVNNFLSVRTVVETKKSIHNIVMMFLADNVHFSDVAFGFQYDFEENEFTMTSL